jgi:O-antigen/teichoic acid export membrane protein
MTSLRQSLALTFLSSNGATAIQFVVTVVLARLLNPDEVGIYSVTAVMVSIAHLFRDFGVASYLQQEKELTREKVGAAFGVLLTSSWAIAALVFLLSWPAATFYGQEGIRKVMQVMALGFMFIPFGAVTHSLLTRDYRAKEQAYVRVAGTLAYAISAIGFAYMGFSYMSMAWANLINIIVTALAYMPFRPAVMPWLPRFKDWRRVLHFGAGATLGNSLGAINSAIPDVVLGKTQRPIRRGPDEPRLEHHQPVEPNHWPHHLLRRAALPGQSSPQRSGPERTPATGLRLHHRHHVASLCRHRHFCRTGGAVLVR